MKLIVGLGNPGKKYDKTRHNVGFEVLDLLSERCSGEVPRAKFESRVAECRIGSEKSLLIWPETYMNRSGFAVQQAVAFYKAPLENVLIICDDFNLPLGRMRYRAGGSSGGQNGLKDIIRAVGSEETPRLRIGVGPVPERWNAADFVLGRFTAAEADEANATVSRAADSVAVWAESGISDAMNRYN